MKSLSQHKIFKLSLCLFSILTVIGGTDAAAKLNEEKILSMLDKTLEKLPEKIAEVPDDVKRVSFFSIRIEKKDISKAVFRQIRGRIESKFLELTRPVLVYAPEVKPVKVVATEDDIRFTSVFQTTPEIKKIARELRIDGFLEGELCITSKKLYLTIRIFDSETMEIIWSESIDSSEEEETPMPPSTGVDFGFGGVGIYLSETSTTDTSIPEFAKYYCVDLRVAQKLTQELRTLIILSGGVLYLGDGIESSRATFVSASKGRGTLGLLCTAGIRIPVIPVITKFKERERDWLAAEVKLGKIWASRSFETETLGIKLECDVTRNLSFSAGISYARTKTVKYTELNEVKVGGLLYEISLLHFNYRP
ncbi:hypothetical protein ACFLUV_04160 [Elusimicrobiota bacterium]